MSDQTPVQWPAEFAKLIGCAKCSKETDRHLMRDSDEHVPQPGYIGADYKNCRLLLVGQNPHVPNPRLVAQDREYTAALRALRDNPTNDKYENLLSILCRFIHYWPVQNNHFPLLECKLQLKDIAYVNLVRCRTCDHAPNETVVKNCRGTYFDPWLDKLQPRCVVFIGFWACRRGGKSVEERGIPYTAVNRDRSLTAGGRDANRAEVAAFVRRHIHCN